MNVCKPDGNGNENMLSREMISHLKGFRFLVANGFVGHAVFFFFLNKVDAYLFNF